MLRWVGFWAAVVLLVVLGTIAVERHEAPLVPSARAQLVQPGTAAIVNAIDAACTHYHLAGGTGASTNANEISSTKSRLCWIYPINTTTTIYYLKIYDTNTSPASCGATNLAHTIPIPPAAAAGGAGGMVFTTNGSGGEQYTSGIGFCVTANGSDSDNTAAAAGVYIEAGYRTVPP